MHINHTVFFKLVHAKGSDEERAFFTAANKLDQIPGVINFCKVNETSPKNCAIHTRGRLRPADPDGWTPE